MTQPSDLQLLAQFTRENSESAFAVLVERHVGLVYSVALRSVANAHAAEEITQAVFIILARKAGGLSAKVILSGWLYQTTRLTAANFLRTEIRRQHREQEAYMQSLSLESDTAETWSRISPLLDDALDKLGAKDRDAVVLRFFENRTMAEIGAALGASEAAAKMRVNRALEKLRRRFTKRGVNFSALAIAGAAAANSVQAAPADLAAAITTAAKGEAISTILTTLVKGTMKTMTWINIKFAAVLGLAVLLAGGATMLAVSQTIGGEHPTPREIIKSSQAAYAELTSYGDEGKTVASVGTHIVAPTKFAIKLARPNLYKIEWTQDLGFYLQTGIVWSAGGGDYMTMSSASQPAQYPSPEVALSAAMGVSGGASGTIPMSFFNLSPSRLAAMLPNASRKPDDNIGGTDCYVLAHTNGGRSQILWIGKKDFLIRQFENDASAAAVKAMLAAQAQARPELKAVAGDLKSVETHANIIVNQKFSPAEFAP